MDNRPFDLIAVIIIVILVMWLAITGSGSDWIRASLGVLLVFVLPGYTLTAAIFSTSDLGVPERVILSLGLSIIVAVLGGFILHWTPWGLQASSWAVLLGTLTLGNSCFALIRYWRNPQKNLIYRPYHLKWRQIVLFGLAGLMTIAAIVIARSGEIQQNSVGFTQLWLLPADKASSNMVRVGISNQETTLMKYSLQLKIGERIINNWSLIELKPGEQWETNVTLPIRQTEIEIIEARLYRVDKSGEIYRHVTLRRPK